CCCYLRKTGRGRGQQKRRSEGASQPSALGTFSLDRLIWDGRKGRFSVLTPLGISLQKFGTGEESRHENRKQVQSRMRLAGSMCKCRARARILRIGICGSEQERGPARNTTVGHENREEGVLRGGRRLRHPATLHTARRNSDHRHPDENF